MVKIAILSPKNAKLVVDNPLVLAQFGDESFNLAALTMRGLTPCTFVCWLKTKIKSSMQVIILQIS